MRAKEFIISEGPLVPVPQDKQELYRDVWRNEYINPGELRNDYYDDDEEYSEYLQDRDPFTSANKLRRMGTGAEAAVIKHDDENGVIKVIGTYQQLSKNAHLQYLLATKKYANANPYFPRVLSTHVLPHISGKNPDVQGFVVRTERLFPLEDATPDELRTMAGKVYGIDYIPNFADILEFSKYIKRGINGTLSNSIIDPAFKQAAELIIAVARKIGSKYPLNDLIDLHSANMMIRKSKFGPQLVLSDPLYNGDEWRNDQGSSDESW